MVAKVEHPSVDDRRARGKEAGNRTPPSSHAGWEPAAAGPTRSPSSRSRTSPGSRTWCRCGTVG